MKQLTQKLKSGQMQILEVPVPFLKTGQVLIKNHFSVISAGTEASTVKSARKGYIGKAKDRPQQARQVLETLRSQGPVQAYRTVMKKLDAYSPLGYSCVGEVIEVAPDVTGFKTGDLVACGGSAASHAEVVNIPVNLCVSLHPDTDIKQAAYNTLGAIAMQAVRQADLRLGETCAVIGLGLLGQISTILLKASGIKVVGIDVNPAMIKIAEEHCLDLAFNRTDSGIIDKISQFSGGMGCDAVIIAASSTSHDPINFAGAISRKRGTVVILGAVPTGFEREPHFYKKELQIRMSCSYGPGRYDLNYEDKGIDYPPGYVRWTENRNMQAFQELIYSKKIDLSYLSTHTLKLDDAPAAYEMMIEKSETFIGIIIEYDTKKNLEKTIIKVNPFSNDRKPQKVSIGFIGAGSYAQGFLLPNIPKTDNVSLHGVMTATPASSRSVAERFGFKFCTGDEKDLLENEHINTVFIATRHDSHAKYVLEALKAGKNVFVEKPLCLTMNELDTIIQTHSGNSLLMVGYNRRFSPLAKKMKGLFNKWPVAMNYRINAGSIPADSWIQDIDIGGGRIIGEVCHFVDLLTFLTDSLPVSVYATVMKAQNDFNDILNISLSYMNGSIGTISYFSNGDKSLPKERLEVFSNGSTVVLDDFRILSIHDQGKKKVRKLLVQDKGQKAEVKLFIDAILKGTSELIPFDEICSTSLVTFKVLESLRSRQVINII